jgi:hypothetical protein
MSGWSNFLSPLLAGLAGAISVALLARFGITASPDREGWRHIRPSVMHWIGMGGSAAFASLVLYVRLFVGSARADAETQMMWANLIIAGFTIGALVSLWQIRRIQRGDVHWRGSTINFTDADGRQRIKPMTEVAQMQRRWTGTIVVTFGDGSELLLDQYAKGLPELWNRIVEVNDGPDDEAST